MDLSPKPMSLMTRSLLSAATIALALPLASLPPAIWAGYAQAQVAPSWTSADGPRPETAALGPSLPSDQMALLTQGLDAARRGDWSAVRALRDRASAPEARGVLTWRMATADPRILGFSELRQALVELEGFPQQTTMRARAEEALLDAALSPAETIAWLEANGGPQTGEGKFALTRAYLARNDRASAQRTAADMWRTNALDSKLQGEALSLFGSLLTAQDHSARVDMLLWRERRTQAQPLIALADPADQRLFQARLRYAAGLSTPSDDISLIAAEPSVLFERARRARRSGDRATALALLTQIRTVELPAAAQEALWDERRAGINEAIRGRDWQAVYQLASRHGLRRGEDFADGEFIAGWAALRFLREPETAARHFATLDAGVRSPISKARALYWSGRAAEAMNNRTAADSFYAQAARNQTTFYGQLAALRLSDAATLALPPPIRPTAAERERFYARKMARIAHIVGDLGDTQLFRQFALAIDDQLTSEGEHQLLAELARSEGEPAVAVRTAKAGVARGVIASDAAFPLPSLPAGATGEGRAEPALVYAITRQESEFDTRAVSRAGARGMMQLMPATAQAQARRLGVGYNFGWLTSDPGYNMMLGASYLGLRVNEFDGSYILAIASYNAGAARIRQWIEQYGDPRAPGVDPIDWIEMIPFQETRNYVHRVLENVQIYRTRMAGQPARIELSRDLTRGQRAALFGFSPPSDAPAAAGVSQ
jgi:soluble lytic murein transglycosylase